jgi:non-reducing end alpha-L-arabinofuranosidase
MTRRLNSKYSGPLYQVRKGGSALGTGGTTQDIGALDDGTADGAAHEAACGTGTCTVSILYDQSGKGNDLKVAPKGCYTGTASEADYESSATKRSLKVNGHKVYALYMIAHDGYRNNTGNGMPTGATTGEGIYELADGKRIGSACCWDFGNASKDNCNGGTMNALFFGTGYWGKGTGNGPWFLADLEGGVWAGGSGASNATNSSLPSSDVDFAFGVLKSGPSNYAISVGNGQSGSLTKASDGATPKTLSNQGGIILGIGGDNSNSSLGTFFEGAITTGRPSDATDSAVLANVQAAKYEM